MLFIKNVEESNNPLVSSIFHILKQHGTDTVSPEYKKAQQTLKIVQMLEELRKVGEFFELENIQCITFYPKY